jgi:ribosomal-protein-alanine N-acetyltransferase
MGQNVDIEAYTIRDKEVVLDLLRLNTPTYFSLEEINEFSEYLDSKIDRYFVIKTGNIIVGCGGINYSTDRTIGKLSWDILHPNFQRQGFGTLLLNYRLGILKNDTSVIKITVRTSQLAYKFYEKSGFKLTNIVKDYWADGFDLYQMDLEGQYD